MQFFGGLIWNGHKVLTIFDNCFPTMHAEQFYSMSRNQSESSIKFPSVMNISFLEIIWCCVLCVVLPLGGGGFECVGDSGPKAASRPEEEGDSARSRLHSQLPGGPSLCLPGTLTFAQKIKGQSLPVCIVISPFRVNLIYVHLCSISPNISHLFKANKSWKIHRNIS